MDKPGPCKAEPAPSWVFLALNAAELGTVAGAIREAPWRKRHGAEW